eukprot:3947651-Lingulodinium_polyedra.AAC.1
MGDDLRHYPSPLWQLCRCGRLSIRSVPVRPKDTGMPPWTSDHLRTPRDARGGAHCRRGSRSPDLHPQVRSCGRRPALAITRAPRG